MDASEDYTKAKIADAIKDAYANKGGVTGVNDLVNGYLAIISTNTQTISDAENTIKDNSALASLAVMKDGTDKDTAIKQFVEQVKTAKENLSTASSNATADAKKVDGQDAIISVNGIKYQEVPMHFLSMVLQLRHSLLLGTVMQMRSQLRHRQMYREFMIK